MSVPFGLHAHAFGAEQVGYYTEHLAGVAEAADLTAPVDTCGNWTLADLVWHLTEVQHFWAWIIERRPAGPEDYVGPERPDDASLTGGLRECNRRLVAQLSSARPEEPSWTWHPEWKTVSFTLRRQSHEALIHCFDAVLATGAEWPAVSGPLAADGFDEVVRVVAGGVPDWARYESLGTTVKVTTADTGDSWVLEFGAISGRSPSGTVYEHLATINVLDGLDSEAPLSVQAEVTGSALDLDLWVWGRGGLEALTVEGSTESVTRLRNLVAETTQ